MEKWSFNSEIQNQALINELKGNLFEFLIASQIAQKWKIEGKFFSNIPNDYLNRLNSYQNWIFENEPSLASSIIDLVSKSFQKIENYFEEMGQNVFLVGKIDSSKLPARLHECDVLCIDKSDKLIPMSLKLSKHGAFVNTKSGGVKSFVETYFGQFKSSSSLQEELNQVVNNSFMEMGKNLYEMDGLEFNGNFDESWKHSKLPGQLSSEQKEFVHEFYQKINQNLYGVFSRILSEDPDLFKKIILKLAGFSVSDMLQIICFYRAKYEFSTLEILKEQYLVDQIERLQLADLRDDISSFEITMDSLTMQIRVKPMNIFTVPAVKINCSIRYTL